MPSLNSFSRVPEDNRTNEHYDRNVETFVISIMLVIAAVLLIPSLYEWWYG